jgi:hypothetical protein
MGLKKNFTKFQRKYFYSKKVTGEYSPLACSCALRFPRRANASGWPPALRCRGHSRPVASVRSVWHRHESGRGRRRRVSGRAPFRVLCKYRRQ